MYSLERRIDELRAERVQRRRNIAQASAIADPIDRLKFIEMQQIQLRGTEREYAELKALTRRRPVVVLTPPKQARPAPPRRASQSSSYVTKVITPRQGENLFGPIDPNDRIEIDGNTVRVYERDGVRHLLAADYWRQVRG